MNRFLMYPNVSKDVSPRSCYTRYKKIICLAWHRSAFRCCLLLNRHISIQISQPSCVMCVWVSDVIKASNTKKTDENEAKGWNDQIDAYNSNDTSWIMTSFFFSIAVKSAQDSFTDWLWWNLFCYWFCSPFLNNFYIFSHPTLGAISDNGSCAVSRETSRSFFLSLLNLFYSWFELIEKAWEQFSVTHFMS